MGDVISIDELPLLIAVEQSKQRGVDVEVTSFKSEEVATQAVINGQADVGQGTPYAAVQKLSVPIRFFYQLSSLLFYPGGQPRKTTRLGRTSMGRRSQFRAAVPEPRRS